MTDLTLDQEVATPLVQPQESETTIHSLLYERYAQDVLASHGINTIPRIEVGDRTINLNGIECRPEEFLTLFFQTRFKRSMFYGVEAVVPGELRIFNRIDHSKSYTILDTPEGITCTCPDYHNQWKLFQEHPATWEAIGGQPRCKHIFRAGIYWGNNIILSVVPEKLIAHVLGVPASSLSASPSN